MRPLLDLLQQQNFLQGMAPAHLQILTHCATRVEFAAAKTLANEGDAADYFYIVRKGLIALELSGPGSTWIAVESVGAGEVLGWSWIVPPHRWRYRARTVESTQALALGGPQLRAACEADEALGYDLLKRFVQLMGQRIEASRYRLAYPR